MAKLQKKSVKKSTATVVKKSVRPNASWVLVFLKK